MKDDTTSEQEKNGSSGSERLGVGCGCLFIVFIAWCAVGTSLEKFFPNFFTSLPGYAHYLITTIAFIFIVIVAAFLFTHISDNKDIYIPITIKIIIGLGLLALMYWVYPKGITDIPISSVKVGDIGRLFVVLVAGLAFLADIFFLVVDIRELL